MIYWVITYNIEKKKYITHLETNDWNEAIHLKNVLKNQGKLSFIDYKNG